MDITIQKVVRHWGFGDAPNGYIPRKLDGLINELMQARLEIPQEYWGDAYIEVDPECSYGDYYPRFIVGFTRPENADEAAARVADEHKHWQEQLQVAQDRVAYCEGQLGEVAR